MHDSGQGHVWIVGAGPGDPGLLTLDAARALAAADVVLYDALVSRATLAHARAGADLVFVGKRAGQHAMPQAEIEALMLQRAGRGARVVRLKGGDPFVFGRGGEEALACRRAGVAFTVVPGITSAIAAPAYAGIPVTHRGLSSDFHIVTAAAGDDGSTVDWAAAAAAGTLVVLMGASNLNEVAGRLLSAGKPPGTPAACIRWGTRFDQQVVRGDLGTIARLVHDAGLGAPLVTVVGSVAALGEELAWFRPGPFAGKRVVVTRPGESAGRLAAMLESLGAEVVDAPVMHTTARAEDGALQANLGERWDWVVFASANGVAAVVSALEALHRDVRALAGARLAAIGEATASALRAHGLRPDFQPLAASSAALAAQLPVTQGDRVLLPGSSLSGQALAACLRDRGALVQQVVAYDTSAKPLDGATIEAIRSAAAVTFTSASTVRFLGDGIGGATLPESVRLVSIGPETSAALLEVFGRVDAQAAQPALGALVDACREVLDAWD